MDEIDIGKESVAIEAIEGQLALNNKNYELALEKFSKYYRTNSNEKNALLIAELIKVEQSNNEAASFLLEHTQKHPSHNRAQSKLAHLYLSLSPSKSIPIYESLLTAQTNNTTFLNNIAWAYGELGETAKGIVYANKAYKLDETNAAIIDTYVSLLIKDNNIALAKSVILKALESDSSNPDLIDLKEKVETL